MPDPANISISGTSSPFAPNSAPALGGAMSTSPDALQGAPAPVALLRQLEWRIRHAVENTLSGQYRSTFRGRGMEFDQVVKYEFGDDVRDIDWNVTARLGEPYRKKFVEEREVTLFLIFEDTPGLQFGSTNRTKRETLLELAGLLMLLGAINRDRVGLLHVTPDGYRLFEPARGRSPILHTAARLLGSTPPSLSTPDNTGASTQQPQQPDLIIPWHLISHAIPRHSLLLWLGDHLPRPQPSFWPLIKKRYQPLLFRVDDPWDNALPHGEPFAAYDPLTQRLVTLDNSHAQRNAHAQWTAQRNAHFQSLLPNHSDRLVVTTDAPVLDTLIRFFQSRQKP